MVHDIFPNKKDPGTPDDIWETDVICKLVNSLNAISDFYKRKHFNRKGDKINETTYKLLNNSQLALMFLLEETGRLDKYERYLKEKEKKK